MREARAQARERVEIRVNQREGLSWLTKGPGRDRPDEPGWTNGTEGQTTQTTTTVNVLIAPQWIMIRAELLQTLEAFSEARAAIAHVLSRLDGQTEGGE